MERGWSTANRCSTTIYVSLYRLFIWRRYCELYKCYDQAIPTEIYDTVKFSMVVYTWPYTRRMMFSGLTIHPQKLCQMNYRIINFNRYAAAGDIEMVRALLRLLFVLLFVHRAMQCVFVACFGLNEIVPRAMVFIFLCSSKLTSFYIKTTRMLEMIIP